MKAKKIVFVHNSNVIIKCHHNERKYIVLQAYTYEVTYCTKEDMNAF